MWIKATCSSSLIVHVISLPSLLCGCNHSRPCKDYKVSFLPVTCKGCLRYLRQWPAIESELAAGFPAKMQGQSEIKGKL